jgi:drug/metabolite transporter (DMT)-like permease
LALEVGSITRLNWQGVAYGFLAAMGCTSFIIVNIISMRTVDPQSVNFHCLSGGALLFWVFLLFTDSQTITLSQPVMLKMVLSGISLTFAYITFFTGVEIVGPVRGAMLLNMEPILTIILAAVLLGERLSILQLSGALLVIAGIVMIARGKSA